MKHLLKKGELENSSRLDWKRAKGSPQDESTMDKKKLLILQ
jgi:hypothetical protein